MFTVPDTQDAAPTCPPFHPVGPHPNGFFADCDPEANFDGTRPIAEHWNELILNLRALLVHASIAAVKGDPTMLWRAIQAMAPTTLPPNGPASGDLTGFYPSPRVKPVWTIDTAVTVHVAPGGSPTPANPLGGDPFDNLASAFGWLGFYTITARGSVTIYCADGTYTYGGPVSLYHHDGDRITVAGTSTATVMYFPSSSGLLVPGALLALTNMTINGGKAGGSVGLDVTGSLTYAANLYVQGWDAYGVRVQNNGFLGFDYLFISTINGNGFGIYHGGAAFGNHLDTLATAQAGGPIWVGALDIENGGRAWITQIDIQTSHKAITVSGTGCELRVAKLNVSQCDIFQAVEANNGGAVINAGPGNRGDWNAMNGASPLSFFANVMGLIRADGAFSAANLANCSPGVVSGAGTGNLGSWTIAT